MGKIRKEKRYRLHKKAPAAALGATAGGKSDELTADPIPADPAVPPLPEAFMKSEPVVHLRRSEQKEGEKCEPIRKKDRRKQRREKWLQSKQACRVLLLHIL